MTKAITDALTASAVRETGISLADDYRLCAVELAHLACEIEQCIKWRMFPNAKWLHRAGELQARMLALSARQAEIYQALVPYVPEENQKRILHLERVGGAVGS